MDTFIQRHFGRIGARVRVDRSEGRTGRPVRLDIGRDREGEFFDIRHRPEVGVEVVDIRPDMRHLLVLAREGQTKHKFLCGHDERAWFVAAVPEMHGVSGVTTAMRALKPPAVRSAESRAGVNGRKALERRNAARVRQGEWFFVPVPGAPFSVSTARRNEPLVRSGVRGSKPHMADYAVTAGGELVYVRGNHAITPERYAELSKTDPVRARAYIPRRRNSHVFVKGRIRHPDHATITLDDWHQVFMNTESQAKSMAHVAFID